MRTGHSLPGPQLHSDRPCTACLIEVARGRVAVSGWNTRLGSYTLSIHSPLLATGFGSMCRARGRPKVETVLRTAGRVTLHVDPSIATLADTVMDSHARHS